MTDVAVRPVAVTSRPYHHGDLRRALIEAACAILEREGPQALSLRAVAREAGVSAAAPYHHFKDKSELLTAVANEGFHGLGESLRGAIGDADPSQSLVEIGLAYVRFAQAHPALYRTMYDSARNDEAMPAKAHEEEDSGFQLVREALVRAGANPSDAEGLELGCIAAWCAAHGLAEMANFIQFRPLIEAMGGEDAFLKGVLSHLFLPKDRW